MMPTAVEVKEKTFETTMKSKNRKEIIFVIAKAKKRE